jgi:LysM repeat protein
VSPTRSGRALLMLLLLGAVGVSTATPATAAEATYTLGPGETLAGLATQLYGASWKAVYITTRNGLASEKDVPAGTKVIIPACAVYKVRRGEILADIAKRWLGDRDRFKLLAQENGIKDPADLEVGTELLVPFVLRHVAEAGDSWSKIAQRYYRNTHRAALVKDYNAGVTALSAGDKVLVPIFDRATVDAASRRPAKATAKGATPGKTPPPTPAKTETSKTAAAGPVRSPAAPAATPTGKTPPGGTSPAHVATPAAVSPASAASPTSMPAASPTAPGTTPTTVQPAPAPGTTPSPATPGGATAAATAAAAPDAAARPPTPPHSAAVELVRGLSPTALHTLVLRAVDEYKRAEFEVACGKLEAALGAEVLPLPDRAITVSYLGFCAIAAGDRGAAMDYFKKWLELDPKAELDPVTTSPKILAVFQEVAESVRGETNEAR